MTLVVVITALLLGVGLLWLAFLLRRDAKRAREETDRAKGEASKAASSIGASHARMDRDLRRIAEEAEAREFTEEDVRELLLRTKKPWPPPNGSSH